jgi:preprotein translocase subunit SecD
MRSSAFQWLKMWFATPARFAGHSREEAEDLAVKLRFGALPAAIDVVQERTVEASLGANSIHDGLLAGVAGLAAVVAAMLF